MQSICYRFDLSEDVRINFDTVLDSFEKYTNPRINCVFERFILNSRVQEERK